METFITKIANSKKNISVILQELLQERFDPEIVVKNYENKRLPPIIFSAQTIDNLFLINDNITLLKRMLNILKIHDDYKNSHFPLLLISKFIKRNGNEYVVFFRDYINHFAKLVPDENKYEFDNYIPFFESCVYTKDVVQILNNKYHAKGEDFYKNICTLIERDIDLEYVKRVISEALEPDFLNMIKFINVPRYFFIIVSEIEKRYTDNIGMFYKENVFPVTNEMNYNIKNKARLSNINFCAISSQKEIEEYEKGFESVYLKIYNDTGKGFDSIMFGLLTNPIVVLDLMEKEIIPQSLMEVLNKQNIFDKETFLTIVMRKILSLDKVKQQFFEEYTFYSRKVINSLMENITDNETKTDIIKNIFIKTPSSRIDVVYNELFDDEVSLLTVDCFKDKKEIKLFFDAIIHTNDMSLLNRLSYLSCDKLKDEDGLRLVDKFLIKIFNKENFSTQVFDTLVNLSWFLEIENISESVILNYMNSIVKTNNCYNFYSGKLGLKLKTMHKDMKGSFDLGTLDVEKTIDRLFIPNTSV